MADRFQSLMFVIGNDISVRWLITLLHFLWQGPVVGGLVVIAGRLLRGHIGSAEICDVFGRAIEFADLRGGHILHC